MLELALNPTSFQGVVHWLGLMAHCSDYSAIHTLDCFDYADCYATLVTDSDSGSCFPHTVLVAVIDSD